MIYPAVAPNTMGGTWVDYNLNEQRLTGLLFLLEESKFLWNHGANRLGLPALMQGLADGYLYALNYWWPLFIALDRTGKKYLLILSQNFEEAEKESKGYKLFSRK